MNTNKKYLLDSSEMLIDNLLTKNGYENMKKITITLSELEDDSNVSNFKISLKNGIASYIKLRNHIDYEIFVRYEEPVSDERILFEILYKVARLYEDKRIDSSEDHNSRYGLHFYNNFFATYHAYEILAEYKKDTNANLKSGTYEVVTPEISKEDSFELQIAKRVYYDLEPDDDDTETLMLHCQYMLEHPEEIDFEACMGVIFSFPEFYLESLYPIVPV